MKIIWLGNVFLTRTACHDEFDLEDKYLCVLGLCDQRTD